jgi:hypothetical protein
MEGALAAQTWLRNDLTVHAVDLSSATDRFPRDIQMFLLKQMGYGAEAEFIDEISAGAWFLSKELRSFGHQHLDGEEAISYAVGQPQGMYGSFPIFGLTHNFLLMMICDICNIHRDEHMGYPYRVLGDDVVIANDDVYTKYMGFLKRLDVEVSHSKCVTSKSITEFAGYVISKDQIIQPVKVPDGNWENGFLNYIKVLGLKGISSLPSKTRGIARAAAQLPEYYGGLGMNPHGYSASQRLAAFKRSMSEEIIPKTTSLVPELIKFRVQYPFLDTEVSWLYDQYNLIQEEIVSNLPVKLQGLPTNLNEFLYQLVFNIEDIPGLSGYCIGVENRLGLDEEPRLKNTVLQSWQNKTIRDKGVQRRSFSPSR